MNNADQLIIALIETGRRATKEELRQITEHVAQSPFASRPLKINRWLRNELEKRQVAVPQPTIPAIELHLLKRVVFDQQWPPHTTVAQFLADLHQAVRHPKARIWTYRFLGEPFVGFLSPSHIQNVPRPEDFIVAYSADYGTIKTGFQASSSEAIFTDEFENLIQHR